MSYLLFTVYLFMLSHTVMPHDHHIHDTVEIITELVTYHDHADDDHTHEHQHEEHDDHQLPHHNESQHVEDYILRTTSIQTQLALTLAAYFEKTPTFDLTPLVIDIKSTDYTYIPSKIPISYSSAVPLRAPPVC